MDDKTDKIVLDERDMPTHWYNVVPDLPSAARAAAAPGHRPAARPRRPRAAVPDGAHPAGGLAGADDRDPGPGPRHLPAVAADARCTAPGGWRRRSIRPAHIYYKYEGAQPGRQPQAEHRHRAGLLQQGRGHERLTTETGAGQWGTALALRLLACSTSSARSTWSSASYHQKPYRTLDDPDVRRRRSSPARPSRPTPAARCCPRRRLARLAWASPSPRPSRTPPPTTTPTTRSARCSTTSCCTRR